MTTPTEKLVAEGVSIWLDDLSRERISSGNLAALIVDRNVTGVTTNPTIFAGALVGALLLRIHVAVPFGLAAALTAGTAWLGHLRLSPRAALTSTG